MVTQKLLKELLYYNPDTGIFTRKVTRGNRAVKGSVAGNLDDLGYIRMSINRSKYRAHRLAWLYVYGVWPKDQIDHINQNRTDNRIENLREATNLENSKNTKMRADNTSGVTGVYWSKIHEKWEVKISVNKRQKHLGLFANKKDAVICRRSAEKKYKYHENHGANYE